MNRYPFIEHLVKKYLGFAFNGRRYEFQVLLFGISIAPWLFTKTISFAQLQLVLLHGYLPDFLLADQHRSQLHQNMIFFIQLMTYLGYLFHPAKSEIIPAQDI